MKIITLKLLNTSSSMKNTIKVISLLTILCFQNLDYSMLLLCTYASPSKTQEATLVEKLNINKAIMLYAHNIWHTALYTTQDTCIDWNWETFLKTKKAIKMIDTYITRSLLKSFNLKASQKGNRGYHLDGLGRVNEQDI